MKQEVFLILSKFWPDFQLLALTPVKDYGDATHEEREASFANPYMLKTNINGLENSPSHFSLLIIIIIYTN